MAPRPDAETMRWRRRAMGLRALLVAAIVLAIGLFAWLGRGAGG